MNANEFVSAWHRERDALLAAFTDPASVSVTANLFRELQIDPVQRTALVAAVGSALTDTLYTLLLGLDGAASIGGMQKQFRISTSDGALVAAPGAIEAAAHEVFYGG